MGRQKGIEGMGLTETQRDKEKRTHVSLPPEYEKEKCRICVGMGAMERAIRVTSSSSLSVFSLSP